MYFSAQMPSTRYHNALFHTPIYTGNSLIYRELVKQTSHAVSQLGSQLLYSEVDNLRMKQSSHQSYLITCQDELLSQTAAKWSGQFMQRTQVHRLTMLSNVHARRVSVWTRAEITNLTQARAKNWFPLCLAVFCSLQFKEKNRVEVVVFFAMRKHSHSRASEPEYVFLRRTCMNGMKPKVFLVSLCLQICTMRVPCSLHSSKRSHFLSHLEMSNSLWSCGPLWLQVLLLLVTLYFRGHLQIVLAPVCDHNQVQKTQSERVAYVSQMPER